MKLWLLALEFGFWLSDERELFLDVGRFLCERRLLEGRIAGGRLQKGGKGLLKGKELLKENC
jgi:hypothetical protein